MSLKLGRGESVVSLLCLGIAEKRRKGKSPVACGAGPASKVFIRHPRERSHSNSRTDHAGKCQQQLVREFSLLRKRVGQRLKARRLSQSRRASAASHRRDWGGAEQQRGGDGGKRGGERSKPSKKKRKFCRGLVRAQSP